jgi:hypothetical protein
MFHTDPYSVSIKMGSRLSLLTQNKQNKGSGLEFCYSKTRGQVLSFAIREPTVS